MANTSAVQLLVSLEFALLVEDQQILVTQDRKEFRILVGGEKHLSSGAAVEFVVVLFDQEPTGVALNLLTVVRDAYNVAYAM